MKILMNLFSSFDPSSSSLKLSWLIIFFPIIFINFSMMSKNQLFIKKINNLFMVENFQIFKEKKSPKVLFILIVFLMILYYNILSLLPFSFTLTSHLSFSFFLSLSIWSSIFFKNMIMNTNKFLSHLLPSGSPSMLMPALIIIELVSNIIRPITLSVRLSANLMAGHLIISLIGNASTLKIFPFSVISMTMILMLEVAVSMIQAYVFSTLSSIYMTEI